MTSPTQRTLKTMRDNGYTVQVVEHWNQYSKTRNDLFGIIDVLGLHEKGGMLGVQATSSPNMQSRVKKLQEAPESVLWLLSGAELQVWGWSKRKVKRGGTAVRYVLRRTALILTIGEENENLITAISLSET